MDPVSVYEEIWEVTYQSYFLRFDAIRESET